MLDFSAAIRREHAEVAVHGGADNWDLDGERGGVQVANLVPRYGISRAAYFGGR